MKDTIFWASCIFLILLIIIILSLEIFSNLKEGWNSKINSKANSILLNKPMCRCTGLQSNYPRNFNGQVYIKDYPEYLQESEKEFPGVF